MHLLIVTPIYNDWKSFNKLVLEINRCISDENCRLDIIAVNDCSNQKITFEDAHLLRKNCSVYSLNLIRNLGHQRAIATGLCYAKDNFNADYVIVMDGDGEDKPSDIVVLLEEAKKKNSIIFAKRKNRSEGFIFRMFYIIYRNIFKFLTGYVINFGNFCIIPKQYLVNIINLSEIWNHFAAGIVRSKLPINTVALNRGKRYFGKSHMNFTSLVLHGLSAVSIFTDIMTTRILIFSCFLIFSLILISIWLLYFRFFTPFAVPGWASTVGFGLLVIFFQIFIIVFTLSFNVLNSKNTIFLIPSKQYKDFYDSIEKIIS